jgi:signal transduction histidine kinase
MRPRSLRQALARQWMLFTVMLSAMWLAAMLLLLFVLEDSFIDRHLLSVASTLQRHPGPVPLLPAQFQLYATDALPADIAKRLRDTRQGVVREFWRSDQRYVHAMRTHSVDGKSYVLVYDVTDELTVSPGLAPGIGYAVIALAVMLVLACVLAHIFSTRTSLRVRALIQQVLACRSPQQLTVLAAQEPVQELSALVQLHAQAWHGQLQAVEAERETLAYLGHELRTPLQSARTSLALLADDRADWRAWERLERALARLTRASQAVLWLSSDAAVAMPAHVITAASSCIQALLDEFRPLAAVHGQAFEVELPEGLHWQVPDELVETLLANLLLNAIQHGGAGVVYLQADVTQLSLRNALSREAQTGFGLGLNVAQRLAQRIGWEVSLRQDDTQAICTVTWPCSNPQWRGLESTAKACVPTQ